jgi:very-short-patch-repair endonuclease
MTTPVPRPYLQASIDELEEKLSSNASDRRILEALLVELSHRTTDRSDRLSRRVKERLAEIPLIVGRDAGPAAIARITSAAANAAARRLWTPDSISQMGAAPNDGPLLELLERMRLRLLDLSAKNRLLNYRHPRGSSLRIVDEIPAQVFEALTTGRSMIFQPVFDPSPRAHPEAVDLETPGVQFPLELSESDRRRNRDARARRAAERAGINPSFDLAATATSEEEAHADGKLQTLLLPEDLESRLRKISQEWTTALQETGANKLHLMFGFVEWHDLPPDQVTEKDLRAAPLVVVPVSLKRLDLDRETKTFRYAVEASGEDWSVNITLQEKARREFGVEIPDMKLGEEAESLEDYFRRVESVLEAAPEGWRLRRQLSLGLVSFGKLLMWRDLNPANWPANRAILSNSVMRGLLGEAIENDENAGRELRDEYDIDDLPKHLRPAPPTIIDADSSQHSVLVDVLRGRNLVVQGPPGTGKSQTIANLIGAALASGKRVLFMAEKKAALDVVHRRLTEIGLGEFCVALHSHSAQKKAFLEDLANRLKLRGKLTQSRDLNLVESQLADHRAALNGHSRTLHGLVGKTGETTFEVLWLARQALDRLQPELQARVRDIRIPHAADLSPAQIGSATATAEDFGAAAARALAVADNLRNHPWSAIDRPTIAAGELGMLYDAVRALDREVEGTLGLHDQVRRLLSVAIVPAAKALTKLAEGVSTLAWPPEGIPGDLPSRLSSEERNGTLFHLLEAVGASQRAWDSVAAPWGFPTPLDAAAARRYLAIADRALGRLPDTVTLTEIAAQLGHLRKVQRQLDSFVARMAKLGQVLDTKTPQTLALAKLTLSVVQGSSLIDDRSWDLRHRGLREPTARATLERLRGRANELLAKRSTLEGRFPVQLRLPENEIPSAISNLANAPRLWPSFFSSKYRSAARAYRMMAPSRAATRGEMIAGFREIMQHAGAERQFADAEDLRDLLGAAARGIDSPFERAVAVRKWADGVEVDGSALGYGASELAERLWNAPHDVWRAAHSLTSSDRIEIAEIESIREEVLSIYSALGQSLELIEGPVADLASAARELTAMLDEVSDVACAGEIPETGSLRDIKARLERVLTANQRRDALTEHLPLLSRIGIDDPNNKEALEHAVAARAFVAQVGQLRLPAEIRDWLVSGDVHSRAKDLKELVPAAAASAQRCVNAMHTVGRLAEIRWEHWAAEENAAPQARLDPEVTRLPRLRSSIRRALADEPAMYSWAEYRRATARMGAADLGEIAQLVEGGAIAPEQARAATEAAIYHTLSLHLLRSDQALAEFTGDVHAQAIRRFVDLDDRAMIEFRRQLRFTLSRSPERPGNAYGPVASLTDEALITYQAGRKQPRITIRGLFARAGQAILSMKPCIMMGPQSVAQYLTPGAFQFDIVVMDEASQLKPEDALGAIARGAQLVVVGDPMQLGPTNFFDKQGEDGEDDEYPDDDGIAPPTGPTVLERSESILLAAATRYPTRMLRWHYRSRHPKLVAFSNREFYNGDLIVFPSPGNDQTDDGLAFHRVGDGVYLDNTNAAEAMAVVRAVAQHARNQPTRTLVIVTLNHHQRDLILGLLERAEKDDADLAAFRRRHEGGPEPLDVKNLENVQGDERDVVIVSITFGPGSSGQMLQNFGPINKTGGERRLNVLFTRAKHRLDVFCSFDPADLRVDDRTPRGVQVLRDYLRYAQDAAWASGSPSRKEPGSPFEIAVAHALRNHGLTVDFQVGVAGYFVDLAVVHPDHPGTYILGVECDGATYHSARSARDRDRLRQKVLEGLGWTIHRIWSTDWFRDPLGQSERVAQRVRELRPQGIA